MLLVLTALTSYIKSHFQLHGDEAGQSEFSYLLLVVGVIGVALAIIAAVVAAVNGYLPKIKL